MDTINTSIDTNSVDKKKKSFLPKLLIALSSLFSIVGVGLAILPNHYKSAKAVSYDDEQYIITLSADEISFQFVNLHNSLVSNFDNDDFAGTSIYYAENEEIFTYGGGEFSSTYSYLFFDRQDVNYSIAFGNYISNDYLYRFYACDESDNYIPLVSSITLYLTSSTYSYIKDAIEQDIQANQPYEPNNFLLDAITLLVSPIVLIATGMGTGISSVISSLIYYNGAMSPFMVVIFIFGGLALAFGLSRWIVNLLSSLGQRNR